MRRIMRIFHSQNLKIKLFMYFLLVSLVPILTLGYLSYFKQIRTIENISFNYTQNLINEVDINIFLTLNNFDNLSQVLLHDAMVKEVLLRRETFPVGSHEIASVESVLKSIRFTNDYLKSIFILSHASNNIFASGDVVGNYGVNYFTDDYRNHYKTYDFYLKTIQSHNKFLYWGIENVFGEHVVVLTRKIVDVELGILGVIVIHLSYAMLEDVYSRLQEMNDFTVLLITDTGEILYHRNRHMIGGTLDHEEVIDNVYVNSSGYFDVTFEGVKSFAVYNTFYYSDWKTIVLIPYASLFETPNELRFTTLLIAGASFGIILLVTGLLLQRIFKPLHRLIQLMRRGSEGNMEIRFDVIRMDEIGQLGRSFNKMMSNIEELIGKVEMESKLKVESQMKALESQINPHFLYNTLASIYWTVLGEGNVRAANMTRALSNYFKIGLNRGEEFVTVRQEVEHVKEYLDIQQMRFEDSLRFQIDVEERLADCLTIKFLLQPLVENAIEHGIRHRQDGVIQIGVFSDMHHIVFQVSDNGRGIEREHPPGIETLIAKGYGLKNMYHRLTLYYGGNFSMDYASIPGTETVFTLKIPRRDLNVYGVNHR